MSIKTAKIESVLADISPGSSYSPQTSLNLGVTSTKEPLSFPRILDFAFPSSAGETPLAQIGLVTYVGDGVVHVTGLNQTSIDEIIEIDTGGSHLQTALILGISADFIEAVVLGDYAAIKRGDQARSTGRKLQISTGKLLGRVINPLGLPLDGLGPVPAENAWPVEFPAPGVMDRQPIIKPLHTGIAVLDSIIPIGKGQRELVIGDRKTGKTRTLLDVISNQKGQNVICIYVGVGMQAAKAKATLKLLTDREAMVFTTLVIAMADDPPSLQYIAPYVGAAIAESYMYQGKDTLVIYDDLSKQAKAYRQVSLLLKRSPGRDAYPGDIFFLHSRLLERSSMLSQELKGGSMTAMPIAETQSGDVSDYIITNLMSITDGHIYLDSILINEGFLPAVNPGTSVSRIGGKVQSKLLQSVGELTSRILIRYEEVKSFETINTEISEDTLLDIKRGKRIKEVLSQDSALNLALDEEIVLLALAVSNRLDHFEPAHIVTFKNNLVDYYRHHDYAHLRVLAHQAKKLSELDSALNSLFASFCRQYKLPIQPK